VNYSTRNDAYVYVLPEASFKALLELCSQMFVMAEAVESCEPGEDEVQLCVSRRTLAIRFETYAVLLADALDASQRVAKADYGMPRTH
jgi:hypothetical protein